MKRKLVVFGGGVSGISAALYGINSGYDVTLVESSSKLGGRINSSLDSTTNDSYDNGQHLLVGAYQVFLDILKEIGSFNNLYIQKKFLVNYLTDNKSFELEDKILSGNLGLLLGLSNMKVFSLNEKLNIIKFIIKMKLGIFKNINSNLITILKNNNQSNNAIKILWEPMCVAMLNTSVSDASTLVFSNVLTQSFFAGGFNSKIIIPQTGLSELIKPFEEYFISKGGILLFNSAVKEIVLSDTNVEKSVEKILLTKNKEIKADYYISCLNYDKVTKLLPLSLNLKSSAIISAYLWYDVNFFNKMFSAIIDKKIQWIFNKRSFGFKEGVNDFPEYLSIVISEANELIKSSNNDIIELIQKEINELFPVKKTLLHYKIIKEKKATFLVDSESIEIRKNLNKKYNNLTFAGDWTDLTLPSTIETAARTGKNAIMNLNKIA